MNTRKKGFTITELVVVIAVIGILAAVLIPTFTGVINDANLSADQMAVRQMNLALSTITHKAEGIDEVYDILRSTNLDGRAYKPLSTDTKFVWIQSEGKIAHVDKDNAVLFPEECKNLTFSENDWIVLGTYTDPNRLFISNTPNALVPLYDGLPNVAGVDKVTVFTFMPADDGTDEYAEQREYFKNWIADFAIILNDDFATGSAGICGQYLSTGWERIDMYEDAPAGTCYFLMDAYPGWTITYDLLVSLCSPDNQGNRDGFNCGAYNFSEDNIGKSITVELRLYQPDENGNKTEKYVVCNEIVYTFYEAN